MVRTGKKSVSNNSNTNGSDVMHRKIDKLESLVLGLIQSDAAMQYSIVSANPTESHTIDPSRHRTIASEDVVMTDGDGSISDEETLAHVKDSLGILDDGGQRPSYLRQTDWTSVLTDVRCQSS